MPITDYSTTPGSNTSISGINIAENCAPAGLNDAIRQLMADMASWYSSNTTKFTGGGTFTGNYTFSGTVTLTVAPVFTDAAGTRTALGLGTMATQAAANYAALASAPTFTGTVTSPTFQTGVSQAYYAGNIGNGNPGINWDSNDYLDYDRTTNTLRLAIGGSDRFRVTASGMAVPAGASTPTQAIAAAATTTVDCSTSNVFRISMGTNITTLSMTNGADGQTVNLRFTQDGTGSRTCAFPSSATWTWASGSPTALSTAANAVDLVVATYFADSGRWLASMSRAFA